MEPTADDRLVKGLIARDGDAWEAFLAAHGGRIERACRRALPGPEGVPDAAAEVVRTLLEADCRLLRRFRPGSSLAAYLQVIAYTRTLNAVKAFTPLRSAEGEAAAGPLPDPLEAAERVERLREALKALPERDAQALRLFHLEGLGYAEIAQRLSIPEGQAGMVLARAREKLKAALSESP